MNINKINTNISFSGYKNLVSTNIPFEDKTVSFAYMGMKLNNEDGYNDLDTWKEIQSNLFKDEPPSDYLVFSIASRDNFDVFQIKNKHYLMHDITNKSEEKALLKTYTLLASLIKRIIRTDNPPEDGKLYLTLCEVTKHLNCFFDNKKTVEAASFFGACKHVKHYITAEHINDKISQNMARYFKL